MTITQFGRFRVDLHRRELLADGQSLSLGSRALDLLIVLLEARGKLVTKDELMSRVWPGTVVEENALQAQVSTIRKALGQDRDFIRTSARRGYRFVAEVTTPARQDETPSDPGATLVGQFRESPPPTNLPASLSALVGREAQLSDVADLVAAHRLVTLGGAGGIGKTRLSVELGRRLLPKFADGVWIAELGPLSDPEFVLPTIATVFGVAGGPASFERLAAALASKHLLLLLDNCEHVIDAAARSAEALLQAGATLQVIATSQEPLRVEGECVHRVPALDVPAEGTYDTEDVLQHSAVRLFVVRAREAEPRFSLDARSGAAVATICRRLDGIPLAIELAAARAAALGVEGLASRLDDRFRLLTDGRRTALTRHQTLRATLDWSHELLPEPERVVMRRIAVFAGGFTAEAASSVAASREISASEVVRGLANLVTKSLVTSDVGSATANYRLLETTRAYALAKLVESGELDQVARRHAEYFRDLLEQTKTELRKHPTPERLADYRRWIDDVRAALDWSFSPDGDAMVGVALTVGSECLWFGLSLMDEWRRRVACALSRLCPGVSARREMQLFAALGRALYYTNGPGPDVCAAWTDVLALAERLDDTEYRLNALWGLWRYRIINGECQAALALARKFANLPPDKVDATDLLFGERLLATSLFVLGDLSNARRHLEHVLNPHPAPIRRPRVIRFQLDLAVRTRAILARILWLQGFPDQAMRITQDNVEDARAIDHVITVCSALDAASVVALAVGDLATAERWVATLLQLSATHALGFWQGWAHTFEGQLLIKRGDVALGVRRLRTGLDELTEAKFVQHRPMPLGALAEGLARVGEVAQALLVINEALAHCERTAETWSMAELLRIRGGLVFLDGTPKAVVMAEDLYKQGLDWARRQGALSWELRCAISLAQLWHEQQRTKEARELLLAVYNRFTEGFETADLKIAKALLVSLQ
jgi:predicted ATPase/DNA-binding winged helix-turn-helix (wHTH) protein